MQHLKSRKLYLLIFAITAILLQNQIAEARFNSGCYLEEKSCWGLLIALIVGGIVLAGYWICVILLYCCKKIRNNPEYIDEDLESVTQDIHQDINHHLDSLGHHSAQTGKTSGFSENVDKFFFGRPKSNNTEISPNRLRNNYESQEKHLGDPYVHNEVALPYDIQSSAQPDHG